MSHVQQSHCGGSSPCYLDLWFANTYPRRLDTPFLQLVELLFCSPVCLSVPVTLKACLFTALFGCFCYLLRMRAAVGSFYKRNKSQACCFDLIRVCKLRTGSGFWGGFDASSTSNVWRFYALNDGAGPGCPETKWNSTSTEQSFVLHIILEGRALFTKSYQTLIILFCMQLFLRTGQAE